MSLVERFWPKVNKTETCWLWTASRCTPGYGQIRDGDRIRLAHRVSYEMARGAIPDGLVLDHLCRVLTCVNPAHLEAVTVAENTRRGELPTTSLLKTGRCQRGHPATPENVYTPPNGRPARYCKVCHSAARVRRMRSRAA